MNILFKSLFVLCLVVVYSNCQETEDDVSVPSSPKSDDNPITSVVKNIGGDDAVGTFRNIRDMISDGWRRMRSHIQERWQRSIEKLQRKAVDSMERLQRYVTERIQKASDDTTKQYLQTLNQNIGSITDALRNLMTNVEKQLPDGRKDDKDGLLPAYTIGDGNQ